MNIPSIKLNPNDILPILLFMDEYNNDVSLMKEKIHLYMQSKSLTGNISKRNAIMALAFPTLKILQLKEGHGDKVNLSHNGKILVNIYKKDGEEMFKKKLSKMIYNVDKINANVLNFLKSSKENIFTLTDIKNILIKNNVNEPNKGGKLTKWLNLLKYGKFILHNNNKYIINIDQIKAYENKYKAISLPSFYEVFKNKYFKLKRIKRGNPYIPIPELEKEVCAELANLGFTTFDFRYFLIMLKNEKIDEFKPYFAKPGAREAHGLRIDGNYYYYIALFGDSDGV